MCVWGFGLLYVTWLSRTPVWETRINLVPFQKDDNTSILDLIANIIMFVPFPMLLYGLLQKKIKFSVLSAVGIGLSIIIELLQLITHRGICDVDDLILNSAGAIIGALLTVVLMKAEKKQDEGFTPGQTSSMKRCLGFFFSCSRVAFHARRRRKPSMSISSISFMRQPFFIRSLPDVDLPCVRLKLFPMRNCPSSLSFRATCRGIIKHQNP